MTEGWVQKLLSPPWNILLQLCKYLSDWQYPAGDHISALQNIVFGELQPRLEIGRLLRSVSMDSLQSPFAARLQPLKYLLPTRIGVTGKSLPQPDPVHREDILSCHQIAQPVPE